MGHKSIREITALMKGASENKYTAQEHNCIYGHGQIIAYFKDGSLDLYLKQEKGDILLATYIPANSHSRAILEIKASPEMLEASRSDLEKMMKTETIDAEIKKHLQTIHSGMTSEANGFVKR
jgi:hypothetical protein